MKNDLYDLPDSLYDFAQIPDYHNVIQQLGGMVEVEDWSYHSTASPGTSLPILENYIKNTYTRLAREKKVAYSKDLKYCCFDTGLQSRTQREPVYMMFQENTNPNVDCYWYFCKFFRKGEYDVNKFSKLPEMAFYWDDPAKGPAENFV